MTWKQEGGTGEAGRGDGGVVGGGGGGTGGTWKMVSISETLNPLQVRRR